MFRGMSVWVLYTVSLWLFIGDAGGADVKPNTPAGEAELPAPLVKLLGCPLNEMRRIDTVIANVKCNLNRLTEVYKGYRISHPGAVGILDLTFTIVPDGSVSIAGVTSGTLLDTAFLAAVKTAVRAWQFCPVNDFIGNQEVSFQISFADRNGMVRSILQQTDDILVKKNSRVFKKWCGDAVRKAYRHWLAFKGPAHGSLEFICIREKGRLTAMELTGGSLADHPITEVILPLKGQLVGKRLRGSPEKNAAHFTLLLLDLRAKVTVFDGRMEYQDARGWYYTDPFLFNNLNTPQWKPPNIPLGF